MGRGHRQTNHQLHHHPCQSPSFEKDWASHGYLDTVKRNSASWLEAQKIEWLELEIVRLDGRTPVLFFEVPATKAGSNG